jgi:hypothetical protein
MNEATETHQKKNMIIRLQQYKGEIDSLTDRLTSRDKENEKQMHILAVVQRSWLQV